MRMKLNIVNAFGAIHFGWYCKDGYCMWPKRGISLLVHQSYLINFHLDNIIDQSVLRWSQILWMLRRVIIQFCISRWKLVKTSNRMCNGSNNSSSVLLIVILKLFIVKKNLLSAVPRWTSSRMVNSCKRLWAHE